MTSPAPSSVTRNVSAFRSAVKRSRTMHSMWKLLHRLPEASPADWVHARRTAGIFRVLPNTMLPAPRLINAYDTMEAVERAGIAGAVVECGVWAGGGIGLMAAVSKQEGNSERVFHLFDSFEGLPQPSEVDADVVGRFKANHPDLPTDNGAGTDGLVAYGACAAPLDEVNTLFFDVLDIDPRQVVVHKGWFQDTIPPAIDEIGPVAILRIDGDWYESTKTCLEGLYDSVVDGGFVIVDDYGSFVGCKKAVDDFIRDRKLTVDVHDIDGEGIYFRKSVQNVASDARGT